MFRRMVSVLGALSLATVAAACGSSDDGGGGGGGSASDADSGPIRIGVVFPLTGPQSGVGNQHVNGIKAAVDYINDNGGILGRDVELSIKDSGGNPTQSVAQFRSLVDEGIVAVTGDQLAGYAAMVPEFERSDVISLTQATQDTLWDDPSANPNGFNSFIPTHGYAQLYVDYLVDNADVTKIGVIGSTDSFAASMFEAVQQYAEEQGIEVVTEQFDPNATSVVNQMQALKDEGVDGLISATFGGGQVLSIQAQQALGWDPPAVTSNTLNTAAGVQAVQAAGLTNLVGGPVSRVMLVSEEGAPESEQAQTLLDYLGQVTGQTEFDGTWSNATTWFDGLLVYKAAVEEAGTTDADAVKEVLESGEPFEGLSGEFSYSADSHVTEDVDEIFGLYLGGLPCPRTCVAAPGTLS